MTSPSTSGVAVIVSGERSYRNEAGSWEAARSPDVDQEYLIYVNEVCFNQNEAVTPTRRFETKIYH